MEKNIILFVGKLYGHMIDSIKAYEKETGESYRIALLYDSRTKLTPERATILERVDIQLPCDTTSVTAIQKILLPFHPDIVAATCRGEDQIPLFARVVPHLPYIATPSSESLTWSSEKILMRRRLATKNKKLVPAFTVVGDTSSSSLRKIEEKVGFPLVVKPAGLAASRLVSICFHKEELGKVLQRIFRRIKRVYKTTGGTWEPKVLVEQFMDGDMYSVDGYVDAVGTVSFCPMVYIKTGRAIGFDDFFGYQQLTPTKLKKESIAVAEAVAVEAVHALALRNTTVHIELMRTEDGWQIIEVGARIGGFRHLMYEYSYSINHTMNDILVRLGKRPIIPKKTVGYTAAMKFFAKKEGKLTKLSGVKKAQELASFKKIYINKKIGDGCTYAKHGGSSVFNVILFNPDRAALLADIRRLEQMIGIETE